MENKTNQVSKTTKLVMAATLFAGILLSYLGLKMIIDDSNKSYKENMNNETPVVSETKEAGIQIDDIKNNNQSESKPKEENKKPTKTEIIENNETNKPKETKVDTKTETEKSVKTNNNENTNNTSSNNNSNTPTTNTNNITNNTSNSNTTNNSNTNNTTNNNIESSSSIDLSKIVSDKEIIPDKYNTGTKGNLTKYNFDMDLGLKFKLSGNTVVINFTFEQNHKPEITIQNIDFTNYDKVAIYGGGEEITDSKIKLIFKNCKFNFITTTANLDTDISVVFENCSIQNFGGSNASFNKCFFGGSSHDGMNPHRNVTVRNSYFAGINTYDAQNARHYDGVQIYGSNTIDNLLVENLKFYNCRFEVPAINEVRNGVPSKSGVNAPIMFALEYDNGNNVTFENIIANGGGYSVYATTKNGISYKNVTFKNIKLGYAHLFGILYPMTDANKANTKFINFGYYDSLYVSSVWRDKNGIHVITTNDTLIERKLTCETDTNTYNFTIQAHPKLTRENNSTFKFSQMPYDLDKVINEPNAKFVRCYDTTTTNELSNKNLIRTQKF